MVGGVPLLTLGCYEGPLRSIVMAVKSQGHRAAGRELAGCGVDSWMEYLPGFPSRPTIYPIAASSSGQKLRGFSFPSMLAGELHRRTSWPLLESSVARLFPSDSGRSRGLGLTDRWARRMFRQPEGTLPKSVRGPLVVIDDVVTSGATMTSAVTVAHQLGFEPIVGLALAVAPSV